MTMLKVQTNGRMTSDPEVRVTPQGTKVANFSVAVDRPSKNKGVDFHRVVLWGMQAEFAEKYFKKGHLVSIQGTIQNRSYDNKEGVKIYITEIIGESVQSLERKEKESVEPTETVETPKATKTQKATKAPKVEEPEEAMNEVPDGDDPFVESDEDDDDVPF